MCSFRNNGCIKDFFNNHRSFIVYKFIKQQVVDLFCSIPVSSIRLQIETSFKKNFTSHIITYFMFLNACIVKKIINSAKTSEYFHKAYHVLQKIFLQKNALETDH